MKKDTNLCMGCMVEKPQDLGNAGCPFCGYSDGNVSLASYLTPKTFLKGRYILGKLLSYNGEGALYLAFDTERNIKITVKEYMPDTLCSRGKDEEAVTVNPVYMALYKTYLSEFDELNKSLLKSDETLRIQKVLDVFSENNTVYAVFEYISGISLKSYLSNLGGTLTWEQTKDLFPPLLTTLSIINSQGIIHRGISPSTIIVNERSELYLISFGITASRTFGSELNFEVFSGYAPPELYNTQERQGSWTDVYGISAVLYKVLTGKTPPGASERLEDGAVSELVKPMMINRNIPENVSSVIVKGLAVSREDRIETVAAFVDRLFETPSVNFLEHTGQTVIRKPTKSTAGHKPRVYKDYDNYDNYDGYKGRKSSRRTPKKSNAAAIVLCSVLGLMLIGFLMAIILPAVNPELFVRSETGGDVTGEIENVYNANSAGSNSDYEEALNITTTEAPLNNTGTDTTSIINEPLYKIPNFTLPARRFELIEKSTNYSFLKIVPEYEFNDEVEEGYIFGQDIEPDTEVRSGTPLTLKVSKGKEFVKLPDYKGVKLDEYKGMLSALNIKYKSEEEKSEEVKNTVIRCSAEVGESINVAAGQTVTIYYSSGASKSQNSSNSQNTQNSNNSQNTSDAGENGTETRG